MPNQRYRVRLSPQLAGQLTDLAEACNLGLATLLRLAALDLLEHPERLPELVGAYLSPGECLCTEANVHAWEGNRQPLEVVYTLEELLAQMRVDISTTAS